MYIINGIVYAGEMKEGIYVRNFRILQNLYMLVTFSTGEVRIFDAAELLQYPVYAPLADNAVFRSAKVEDGILVWQNGEIDIAPEALYERSYPYSSSQII